MPELSAPNEWSATTLSVIAGGVLVLFSVLGVLSAIQAVWTARTAQGAIAWSVSLITWPLVAVPAYWVLGRTKFLGYASARRDENHAIFASLDGVLPKVRPYLVDFGSEFGNVRALEKLARMQFLSGNDTELLIDGKATFDAIFKAIASAENYVLVEFFIINDDNLGRQLQRHLIQAVERGVEVYLLYDDVGSARMTKRYLNDLREAGIHVTGMNTTRGRRNRLQLNFRNHRKIVVTDGRQAFVGGLNVGDEYMGLHKKLAPWRDTHMAITGPAALAAQLVFIEDWHWATQEVLDVSWDPVPSETGDDMIFVLPSGPADEYETCGLFFTHAINSAKQRVWIASPYFVPDEGIITALQLAALRGVDVRIMIPGLPDKPFIKWAAMGYVHQVNQAGVKMYEFGDGFLHQKVMLIDDQLTTIGTANFDNRSFRLNFEISILTLGEEFTRDVEEMLKADFANSTLIDQKRLDERSWIEKLGSKVARLFAPIL